MATSKIKGGIETFTLTNPSGFGTFEGRGYYDHKTGRVRIYVNVYHGSQLSTNIIANVPVQYRPSAQAALCAVVGSGTGADGPVFCYPVSLLTNGNITQSLSSVTRQALVIGEYGI